MSTSKYFNKLCIVVVVVMLTITILFMNGNSLGILSTSRTLNYETKLFDTSSVHSINIVMDDWDSFIENAQSEEYSSCTLVIDGEKYSNIGIRAKGNTSLTTVQSLNSDRYSFKLEFDHYKEDNTYYGLDKLCLNNLIQDNTMMKDYIVYQMMNAFNVESPLCSFVYITVNGEDWGLYLAVEGIEDAFMERNYGSDTGNLYKPDSASMNQQEDNQNTDNKDTEGNPPEMPDGETQPDMENGDTQQAEGNAPPDMENGDMQQAEGNTPPDMENGDMQQTEGNPPEMPDGMTSATQNNNENENSGDTQENTEKNENNKMGGKNDDMGSDDLKLKYIDDDPDSYSNIFNTAKTDITDTDKERLISSLKNLSEYKDIENTVNVEEVMRYFVVHNFVCNGDSYTGNMIHNYYLHENDGQLSMIPWDYNLAFGTFEGNNASSSINASIDNPISGGSVDDRPMFGWIESDASYIEEYHNLFSEFIEMYFSNDELVSMIEQTAELIAPYVEKDPTKFCTTDEFEQGVSTLKSFVTLRSQAVKNQLNGDSTTVNTGNLNLSDMGSMNTGMDKQEKGNKQNNILSGINITDSDGNSVDVTSLIDDISNIVSVTLSDGSTIDISEKNTQIDFSKIVSITDTQGNVIDLSEYTITSQQDMTKDFKNMDDSNAPVDSQDKLGSPTQTTNSISIYTWIYLGVSCLLMVVGLLFAIKKY